jgi:hypothetical protein
VAIEKLTPYERECLIERAAIIEYCGNVPRDEAERMAKRQLEEQRTREMIRGFSSLDQKAS